MKNAEAPPQGRLAEVITDRMVERDIDITALAGMIGITYEHTRGLTNGQRNPSKLLLKEVCRALKLPFSEMWDLVQIDQIRKKYGDLLDRMMGRKPGMEPLERVWDELTEGQKQDLITMARGWARRAKNRV